MAKDNNLDTLYKKNFSKMVSGLTRRLGIRQIELAEDIVQETFLAAHQAWEKELPSDPAAWLFKVCKNIALKKIRDTKEVPADVNRVLDEIPDQIETTHDDTLTLLLACAHPRFSPRQQVVFALRYAAGFRVDQIASVLATPYDTIVKMLQRLRAIIIEEDITLTPVSENSSPDARTILLKIIYLIFNEGYKTSQGKSILNLALCEDALSMIRAVIQNQQLDSPNARALYALMLFNLSRLEARFDENGNLVDLESQDRTQWNSEMIALGINQLAFGKTDTPGSYQLEAMIAYLHCTAETFGETNWQQIVKLYTRLAEINPSPFVKLNCAIAKFYSGDRAGALAQMHQLGKMAFINHYYLFHAAMGKMLASNDIAKAKMHFKKAIDLTPHQVEKNYITRLLSGL